MSGRSVAGLLLILLGAAFLLDVAGYLEFGQLVGRFWPLIVIVVGIGIILSHPKHPLGGIIVIMVGLFFLVSRLGYLPSNWFAYAWPVAIILVGLAILFSSGRPRKQVGAPRHPAAAMDTDTIRGRVFFSGINYVVRSNQFRGGDIDVLFGGAQIDLRQAQLAPEGAKLDVSATFGGVEIFVPSTWRIAVNAKPVLGGVDNKTLPLPPTTLSGPVLEINANATLGGIEIKN